MGSLMAGWDAPVHDPRTVKFQRNKSLTKEEIEAFWKSKKKSEEEHLRAISEADMLVKSSKESIVKEAAKNIWRSSSLPLSNTKDGHLEVESDEISLKKLALKDGWWTTSSSAFLNEPPVIATEGPAYKYASQFHVAGIAASGCTGVSS